MYPGSTAVIHATENTSMIPKAWTITKHPDENCSSRETSCRYWAVALLHIQYMGGHSCTSNTTTGQVGPGTCKMHVVSNQDPRDAILKLEWQRSMCHARSYVWYYFLYRSIYRAPPEYVPNRSHDESIEIRYQKAKGIHLEGPVISRWIRTIHGFYED